MQCRPKLRSLLRAANEIDLFNGRIEAGVRKISRRASTSFLAGGVFGAGIASIGAFFAPEMAARLIVGSATSCGLFAAAMSESARWQEYRIGRCSGCVAAQLVPTGRRRLLRLAIGGFALVIILAAALSSDAPLLTFLILGFLVSWLPIIAVGVTALTVELVMAVARFFRRADESRVK